MITTAVKITPEQELYKLIRSGKNIPCFYFFGKDTASLEGTVKKLTAKLVPNEARDLNYHFFAGGEFDVSEFSDVCASLPMFADRVVAAVNDLNAETLRADDLKFLISSVSGIDPETTTVIFYATAVDPCGGKKSLSPKNLKLAEAVESAGGVVAEFSYKRPQELAGYIRDRAAEGGSSISQSAAITLAELCLCNLLTINNEIDKLCAYRAGEEIKEDDIRELVAGQLDTDAYKLAKAVAMRNKSAVFPILEELYSRREDSIALLSIIAGAFTDLYRAKLAIISGRRESDVAADFSYRGREFAVRNAFRDCSRISVDTLRYCLGVLSDCDIDMKSKPTDNRILLETAIIKMLSFGG